MPRDREFDIDAVTERALRAFWARGYEATSMEILLATMGIGRGSFYATFGGKRELLHAMLRRYDREYRSVALGRASAGRPPRTAILAIFASMIDGSRGPDSRHGCFLVNSALELAPTDAEVRRIVRAGFADIARVFADLVRRGQETGTIGRAIGPEALGMALMSQLVGLLVLVRARAPRPALEAVVGTVERLLDCTTP